MIILAVFLATQAAQEKMGTVPNRSRIGDRSNESQLVLPDLSPVIFFGTVPIFSEHLRIQQVEASGVGEEIARDMGAGGQTKANAASERKMNKLIAALKDWDSEVRRNAAISLGQIGDTRAVEPLIAALKDGDWGVRRNAATSLGQIGDTRAVEPLIAALKDRNLYVRLHAATSLGQIGDTKALPALNEMLRSPRKGGEKYKDVRKAASQAIRQIDRTIRQREAHIPKGALSRATPSENPLPTDASLQLAISPEGEPSKTIVLRIDENGELIDPRRPKQQISKEELEQEPPEESQQPKERLTQPKEEDDNLQSIVISADAAGHRLAYNSAAERLASRACQSLSISRFFEELRAYQFLAITLLIEARDTNLRRFAIVIGEADKVLYDKLIDLGYEIRPANNETEVKEIKSTLPKNSFVVVIQGDILKLPGNFPPLVIDNSFINCLSTVMELKKQAEQGA